MRRILSLCLLLALTWPCHAQQKPNTLTPKEIADGWILLFDGETTFGWKAMGWRVENFGELTSTGIDSTLRSNCVFGNFRIEFEYKNFAGEPARLHFGEYSDKPDGPGRIELSTRGPSWNCMSLSTSGETGIAGVQKTMDGTSYPEANFRARANEPVPIVFVGKSLRLRNVKIKAVDTKPLFNGADLTGWREFPSKKSKFAVIDNAINVKDGPGDLQTVGKFKDFILQLECKSNGKHLNSGVFFRCKDNEYQNGYEAQILNKFTEKPTQKYLLEDYDPMTNKLLGKKETLFTAVDWGTGAIYRRQPARKEMSKDGEWFGMTIVAHGNHLATWVNGVQVTDWTDNRPKDDNARKGCCLNAGHISIQGHDPTTDLSFRNIRIAEFK